MKGKWTVFGSILLVVLLALAVEGQAQESQPPKDATVQAALGAAPSAALGTGFTYQGQLKSGDSPVNGNCDFQFSLWDAASGGMQVGTTQTKTNVAVSSGLFTVQLDFGAGAFQGDARWLAIAVRCPAGTGAYTSLSPRQPLTAAPYALYSKAAPWSGLTGVPAGFADGVDNDTTYTAGTGLTLTGNQFSLNAAYTDTRYWLLGGNSLASEGKIGTLNNYALNFVVNNLRALRLEPNATSPNVIGGYSGNNVTSGVYGATIGGGGAAGWANRVTDNYGTVGGGLNNQAGDNAGTTSDQLYATVGGGGSNTASSLAATIGGGYGNSASGDYASISGGYVNAAAGAVAAIGGGYSNSASGNDATISGGYSNSAGGNDAAIGGGYSNTASGPASTISGGWSNLASGESASIGGGDYNFAVAAYATIAGGGPSDPNDPGNTNNRVTDDYGTIGGGGHNRAGNDDGDTANAPFATVGGGEGNTASGDYATVGGGVNNTASQGASTVGGGSTNTASGRWATVGGGFLNNASGLVATVGGGNGNTASGDIATVGGGAHNSAAAAYATIAGGGPSNPYDPAYTNNRVTDEYGTIGGGGGNRAGNGDGDTTNAPFATVGGGRGNTASGYAATVPGGLYNTAEGAFSFAAGRRAKAYNQGCFVLADATDADEPCVNDNRFVFRVTNAFYIWTTANHTAGVLLPTGGNAWSSVSDRAAKENYEPVDGREVLDRLTAIPIQTWNYRSQDPAIRHIGPVAQDFYAAFGVGEDDTHISTVDADGVALVAIQGLYQLAQEQDARITQLEGRVAALEAENSAQQAQMDDLEARLAALEGRAGGATTPSGALPASGLALGGLVVLGVAFWRRKGGGRG